MRKALSDGEFLCSVGFHLIGLPEVFVPRSLSDDELVLSSIIDSIAEEIFTEGVEMVLARHGAMLLPIDEYDEHDLKYNPYGAIYLSPGIKLDSQIN
ncbi:MAG: hypothetical protein E5X58_35160 [Mesorhizobium sp.]|nr:MAG: hypothetical protein E5X58_35160 [Mesorhizobium sp.]